MTCSRLISGCGPALALASTVTLVASVPARGAGFLPLRYDEDYSSLRNGSVAADFVERLKFIPLDATGDAWLTVGGESRSRYEYFRHAQWGAGPQDTDGYLLQRTMLHADWHPAAEARAFLQLKSGLAKGRSGGPRPTDEDRLDLNQAFVDVRWPVFTGSTLTLRAGRQEIVLGSARLVSTREAPNVRQAFDGARLFWQHKGWRLDALALRPAQTKPGVFDDGSDRTQQLWGFYAVAALPKWPGAHLDAYYLGYARHTARFAQGAAHENRQTFGSRLWGKFGGWDYNGELVLQTGHFGAARISAWMTSLDASYTFAALAGKPKLGVRGGVASGDRNPVDGELNTYNGLFPRGAYFHESGLIGPANIVAVDAVVTFELRKTVTLGFDCDFFWRQSEHDGVYGNSVNLVRSGLNSRGRYLGTQPSARIEWRPTHHWLVAATVAHFLAGEAIRTSGPGADVDYFSAWTTYTF